MKNFFVVALLVFILMNVTNAQPGNKNSAADYAKQCIIQLKENGALLVRLHTKSNAIQHLESMGNHEYADQIIQEQEELNSKLMKSFKENFSFCPLYFFYADSTKAIQSGKRINIFLNEQLQVDSSVSLIENFFMVAEFGDMVNSSPDDSTSNSKPEGSMLLRSVFVISDSHFKQMRDPFPYFVIFGGKFAKRAHALNINFEKFYLSAKAEKKKN